jgi:hypothetical protein
MLPIETNCIKVNGCDTITKGTRYVYEGEKLYTEIRKWYLQKIRDEKLENIGI